MPLPDTMLKRSLQLAKVAMSENFINMNNNKMYSVSDKQVDKDALVSKKDSFLTSGIDQGDGTNIWADDGDGDYCSVFHSLQWNIEE